MSSRIEVNENLVVTLGGPAPVVSCAHCGHVITESGDIRSGLAFHEGVHTEAGPQIYPEPERCVDARIVFREWYCPGCWVAVLTQVVPDNHPDTNDEITAPASSATARA